MNRKYTHIFFDLDNTLWDFETNSQKAMFDTFNRFGLSTVVEFNRFFEIYSKNNHLLWQGYRNKTVPKNELVRLRFQLTFNELAINNIDAVAMNAYYLETMPEKHQLNSGAIEILRYLKQKSYKIAIITNGFKEVQCRKIETSGLKPFISEIYISEVVQMAKPESGIFEYAVKSMNAPKAKSIMIGDDWDVDVLGAVTYGIDAVYFNKMATNSEIATINSGHKNRNVYEINELSQLKYLF